MKAVTVIMQNVLVNINNFLCMRQGRVKNLRPKINSTSNKNPKNAKNHLGMVGVLPNPGFFHITNRRHNRQKFKHLFHNPKVQPDRAEILNIKHTMCR